ncbi:hypothetical protein LTR05_000832 [Lithohypha guttulata]|uniref:Uncharacterized protein n=1 Tax=Lithohypha guttulata TaxID=1690604 RepID=A0AAN7Y9U3_9EURO|nr:hypothetical protein LTR05_000832 [Lithohypha guttulata]
MDELQLHDSKKVAGNATLDTSRGFSKFIKASSTNPLVVSKPIRWIIRPESIDPSSLLEPRWDLLLILEDNQVSKDLVSSFFSAQPYAPKADRNDSFSIKHHWTTTAGVPSRLTKDFQTKTNPALLHPAAGSTPALTGALDDPLLNSTSQDLSLSSELQSWIGKTESSLPVHGAVSMLNFLSFKPGMKSSYLKYGAAFAETIGAKRGGNAKLVGNIVHADAASSKKEEKEGVWHEFALAHYPSLLHFADMLASKDYQEVNQKYRVPALGDTCILCTSELEIEQIVEKLEKEGGQSKAKL